MQGTGLGGGQAGSLLQQIGDLFTADGAELKRIRHGPGDLVIAVDLAEGDDLLHMQLFGGSLKAGECVDCPSDGVFVELTFEKNALSQPNHQLFAMELPYQVARPDLVHIETDRIGPQINDREPHEWIGLVGVI